MGGRHTDIVAMYDGHLDAACKRRRVPQIESLSYKGVYNVRRVSNECRLVTDICFNMSEV